MSNERNHNLRHCTSSSAARMRASVVIECAFFATTSHQPLIISAFPQKSSPFVSLYIYLPLRTRSRMLSYSTSSSSFAWISTAIPFNPLFNASLEDAYIILGWTPALSGLHAKKVILFRLPSPAANSYSKSYTA